MLSLLVFELHKFMYKAKQTTSLDILFISNSANGENAWTSSHDKSILNGGLDGDDVDLESHMDYLESLDNKTISDPQETMDEMKQARKRKLKRLLRKHLRVQNTLRKRTYRRAWNRSGRSPNP